MSSRRRWPIVVGVLVVAAAGGALFMKYRGLLHISMLGEPIQAGRPLVAKEYPKLVADKPDGPVVQVALVLAPIDARVFHEGKDLGTMPLSVAVPKGDPLEIAVRRDGYYPRTVSLDGEKDRVVVRLAPVVGAAPAPGKDPGADPQEEPDPESVPPPESTKPEAKPKPEVKPKATAKEPPEPAPAPQPSPPEE